MDLFRVLMFLTLAGLAAAADTGGAGGQGAASQGVAAQKAAAQPSPAVDFNRAGKIAQKRREGGTLTAEEDAYLKTAKKVKAQMDSQPAARESGQNAPAAKEAGQKGPIPKPTSSTGLIPLTDMGTEKYKGEDGGLYGGGSNEPPKAHQEAAQKATAEIQPLDAEGKPAKDGKIVLISTGYSNVTMEFSVFKAMADKDPEKNPNLVIVDGAMGAQDDIVWADTEAQVKIPRPGKTPARDVWAILDQRLKDAGVTAAQVQAAWMKHARSGVGALGAFPAHARTLQANEEKIVNRMKDRFPNLRVIYVSSRTYGGWATAPINPEPYAYESAFAVRWLIQDQINGKPELNDDPAKGPIKAPVLLWGPYLWTDGLKGRKDGLVWKLEDTVYQKMTIPLPTKDLPMQKDCTHPSPSGIQKVDDLLMKFFKTDPLAKTWFTAAPGGKNDK
ncbi:MAG: hypothetical protein NTW86_24150 [Candidatus Sumerlaeota bacterium]|nr:hypothetical protein [Candidatus Sumerlaeota bacterium]